MKPLATLLVLVFLVSSCATRGAITTHDNSGGKLASVSDEVAIGQEIHSQILSTFYAYTDPKVVSYVNEIGFSLASHADRKELPYKFTILYDEKIYATSAPGGFVYVTTGMINFLDNESELAAVMGHEIGQLQFRDPKLSRIRKVLDMVTRGTSMVGPVFGEIGALTMLGVALLNVAVEAGHLTKSQLLLRADKKALHYMEEAGFDPQGMIDLLYKFLHADEVLLPFFYDYYQSRPVTAKRFAAIEKEFNRLPLWDRTFTTNREIFQQTTKGVREIYRR